jgi:hypothetical protein
LGFSLFSNLVPVDQTAAPRSGSGALRQNAKLCNLRSARAQSPLGASAISARREPTTPNVYPSDDRAVCPPWSCASPSGCAEGRVARPSSRSARGCPAGRGLFVLLPPTTTTIMALLLLLPSISIRTITAYYYHYYYYYRLYLFVLLPPIPGPSLRLGRDSLAADSVQRRARRPGSMQLPARRRAPRARAWKEPSTSHGGGGELGRADGQVRPGLPLASHGMACPCQPCHGLPLASPTSPRTAVRDGPGAGATAARRRVTRVGSIQVAARGSRPTSRSSESLLRVAPPSRRQTESESLLRVTGAAHLKTWHRLDGRGPAVRVTRSTARITGPRSPGLGRSC